jgi:hypothetical protein
MDTYTVNIPALDPLGSGAHDNPAKGIAKDTVLQDADVVAANLQHKNRKCLAKVIPPQATEAEVIASERRRHLVQACNFSGSTPPWAVQMLESMAKMQESIAVLPAMQEALDKLPAMQEALDKLPAMQEALDEVKASLDNLTQTTKIDRQRMMNRTMRDNKYPIERVSRTEDGALPPDDLWFPPTLHDLTHASGTDLDALLEFYGIARPHQIVARIDALKVYLGIVYL